jgi:hypothetical protein
VVQATRVILDDFFVSGAGNADKNKYKNGRGDEPGDLSGSHLRLPLGTFVPLLPTFSQGRDPANT